MSRAKRGIEVCANRQTLLSDLRAHRVYASASPGLPRIDQARCGTRRSLAALRDDWASECPKYPDVTNKAGRTRLLASPEMVVLAIA
jgi:hypothetical protein